jgi:competence protein ComEA
MRPEPPVQRLAAVARSRARLLGEPTVGWVPAALSPQPWVAPEATAPDDRPAGDPAPFPGPWIDAQLPGRAGPAIDPQVPERAGAGIDRQAPDRAGPGLLTGVREGIADRVPAGWRPAGGAGPRRVVPVRAAVAAAAVAGALALGLLAHRLAPGGGAVTVPAATAGPSSRSGARASAAPLTAASGGTPTPAGGSAASGATGGGVLVVDVEGRVRRPGLVRVAAGSRVADAVQAAGGAAPGAALVRINLARPLADGEQVVVPGPTDPLPANAVGTGGAAGSGSAGGSAGAAAVALVDLNAATTQQLDTLPGVGPVLAGRIVEWRTAHGRFTSVEELGEVSGIGDALLQKLRPLVRV